MERRTGCGSRQVGQYGLLLGARQVRGAIPICIRCPGRPCRCHIDGDQTRIPADQMVRQGEIEHGLPNPVVSPSLDASSMRAEILSRPIDRESVLGRSMGDRNRPGNGSGLSAQDRLLGKRCCLIARTIGSPRFRSPMVAGYDSSVDQPALSSVISR